MTLNDAIIHVKENKRHNEPTQYDFDHKQLISWLEELQKYRLGKFMQNRQSAEPDDDLPEGPPITMVTETFGGLEIREEKIK